MGQIRKSSEQNRERYWEIAVQGSEETLRQQNSALREKRRSLSELLKYHFIFIGFVLSIFSLGLSEGIHFDPWFVLLSCIPSFIGIIIASSAKRKMGSYHTGISLHSYEEIDKQANSYSDSLKEVTSQNLEVSDRNRRIIEKYDKYVYHNWLLLFVGFGTLFGLIIS